VSDVRTAAEAWLAEDPDPETRAELRRLLDGGSAEDDAELADRFAGTLEFGTAGLRGEVGAGPNRMNRVVVIRAAAGLAAYLTAGGHSGEPVVIGYDARNKSDVFARDTAAVMAGAGLRPLLLPRPLPTPVLAFAIRHLGACAGVMVTASHNPPRDNGYKVYLGDGSQITPPADGEIAAAIAAVGSLADVPRGDGWTDLDDSVLEAYVDRAVTVLSPGGPRDLRVVSTALHGVGGDVLRAAFERAGFAAPVPVPEQQAPDPAFPTVPFPNPEEPGAIDLALALAVKENADLVIANDPDADRCAVAVPLGDGAWRMLRGDEVGTLLGLYLAERGTGGVFATTIVSSRQLSAIATAYGIGYRETLTGFKWLSKVDGLAYAYEEALGYCVDPDGVRDKDGITAALLIAESAARLKAKGRTLLDVLDDAAREFDLYATDQLSVRVDDLAKIDAAMRGLRARPPRELAGLAVAAVTDLREGTRGLPPTDGIRLDLADGARVVIRPSGTEPKLKCYLEVIVAVAGDSTADVAPARARAVRTLAALKHDLADALGLA
jgi:phosphomannomutase